MQIIHEHRRIQILGSPQEKRQLAGEYRNEVDFQLHLKNSRHSEEQKRDTYET
jgi:hypothetical protein